MLKGYEQTKMYYCGLREDDLDTFIRKNETSGEDMILNFLYIFTIILMILFMLYHKYKNYYIKKYV